MITQLLLGSALVCVSIFITVGFMATASAVLRNNGARLAGNAGMVRIAFALALVALWLLGALSVSVWVWAGAFVGLGLFGTLEEALYFSAVAFTTLGFGDIVIGPKWRLLSGVIAANGLILFSLVTAYLIEFVRRLHDVNADEE
ncbi:potassium channel family protein [Qipengyuania flava]|uniref:potassium channel family protein n=1 Tax=Qipengyuania flava TaxID=192812 RepID=UPI001C6347FB|nr:potassium channel family protein [Qipengyuania flava]QYJ08330.1 potassium channel family protein [Qipengyuania flava]